MACLKNLLRTFSYSKESHAKLKWFFKPNFNQLNLAPEDQEGGQVEPVGDQGRRARHGRRWVGRRQRGHDEEGGKGSEHLGDLFEFSNIDPVAYNLQGVPINL